MYVCIIWHEDGWRGVKEQGLGFLVNVKRKVTNGMLLMMIIPTIHTNTTIAAPRMK